MCPLTHKNPSEIFGFAVGFGVGVAPGADRRESAPSPVQGEQGHPERSEGSTLLLTSYAYVYLAEV